MGILDRESLGIDNDISVEDLYVLNETSKEELPSHFRLRKKHSFISPSWRSLLETEDGKKLSEEFLSKDAIKRINIFN